MASRKNKRIRMVSDSEDDSGTHIGTEKQSKTSTTKKNGSSSQAKGKEKANFQSNPKSSQHTASKSVKSLTPFSPSSKNFFRGPSFQARFQNSILSKNIIYEKTLDIYFFQHSALQTLFESCGISSLVFPPTKAYPSLIQQFYANLEYKADTCTTLVKGQSIKITPVTLGNILSIPFTGSCPFTLKGPLSEPLSSLEQLQTVLDDVTCETVVLPATVDVSPISAVIHKILRSNLLPRSGGGANFTFQDLVIVATILKGIPINFASLILLHMDSCVKQNKKSLPYGGVLTKVFEYFNIPFENEPSLKLTESIDSDLLKSSLLHLSDGHFVRLPRTQPSIPSGDLPSSSVSPSPEISSLLQKILTNQLEIKAEVHAIKHEVTEVKTEMTAFHKRLDNLEKGKSPALPTDVSALVRNMEDEFIDLQAGFELHTTAMVSALQRKMNRNACQLSQELKFVSHQVETLGSYVDSQTNDLKREFQLPRINSNVPEWARCNWLAEYQGDFLDLPIPPPTHIPRPPLFADQYTPEERAHRRAHRPYFTKRARRNAVIIDHDD